MNHSYSHFNHLPQYPPISNSQSGSNNPPRNIFQILQDQGGFPLQNILLGPTQPSLSLPLPLPPALVLPEQFVQPISNSIHTTTYYPPPVAQVKHQPSPPQFNAFETPQPFKRKILFDEMSTKMNSEEQQPPEETYSIFFLRNARTKERSDSHDTPFGSGKDNGDDDKSNREVSPSPLSEGLTFDDMHYYIDQRFESESDARSIQCGRKRRIQEFNKPFFKTDAMEQEEAEENDLLFPYDFQKHTKSLR